MATGQFDIVLGGHDADVTTFNGGSIGSSGVRVIVDDTNCKKKEDAIQGINYILNRLKEGTWPPTIFSPLSLFAAGEQGAWYDPSDLATLFQDDAGTIPVTASGDPVGRILDKSGRGNHATQATAGSRPTFREVGGLRYLEFDGVDDFLVTGNINFTSTDKLSVFAGLRKSSDAATAALLELSVSRDTNNGTFAVFAPSGAGANKFLMSSKGTVQSDALTTSTTYNAPVTVALSGSGDISGDMTTLRLNGQAVAATATDQGAGNYGTYPLYIGRRGGTTLPFNGQLHGLVIRGASTVSANISSMEAYMANKTGITLV